MSKQNNSMVVPDGYVRPVYTNNMYSGLLGPGDFAVGIPGVRQIGVPISILPRTHIFTFNPIYSSEGIPLKVVMAVEYAFDPRGLPREVVAEELKLSPEARRQMIHTVMERVLRELVARHEAQPLHHHPSSAGLGQELYIRIAKPLLRRGIKFRSSQSLYTKEIKFVERQDEVTSAPPPPADEALHEQPTPPMAAPSPPIETPAQERPLPEDPPEFPEDPPKPQRPDVLRRR